MKLTKESIIWILVHLAILLIILFFNNQFICDSCKIIGWLLVIVGAIIWLFAKKSMGKISVSMVPEKFVSKGIYSKIRHPLYLGVKLIFIGLSLVFKSTIGLSLVIIILIPLHFYRAKREEREMIKKFGDKYKEYKRKTLF